MQLSITSSVSKERIKGTCEQWKNYERSEIARHFAYDLANKLQIDSSCIISETNDDAMVTMRYELHVFTPEELRRLVHEIEGKIRLGLPIIY
jgi:hypothetical protein